MVKITDFITLEIDKKDLISALKVLKEFKGCESNEEFILCSLSSWTKLEQLEEFLEHRVNGTKLEDDTLEYIKR